MEVEPTPLQSTSLPPHFSLEEKKGVEARLSHIISLLSHFKTFHSHKPINFFIEDCWGEWKEKWLDSLLFISHIPFSSHSHLSRKLEKSSIRSISKGSTFPSFPPTLQDYITSSSSLSISKTPLTHFAPQNEEKEKMHHSIKKGMSPKKYHEVTRLSSLIYTLSRHASVPYCVDIGSGAGYLSQALACRHSTFFEGIFLTLCLDQYGVSVLCVEASTSHSQSANKRVHEIDQWFKKKKEQDVEIGEVTNLCEKIRENMTSEDFFQLIRPLVGEKRNGVILSGLHACGDLSSSIIRMFCEHEIDVLALVSCCYHRVTTQEITHTNRAFGFPMSTGVKRMMGEEGLKLNHDSLVLGCHAEVVERGEEELEKIAEKHFFRSVLQKILDEYVETDLDKIIVRRIRSYDRGSFLSYFRNAVGKINVDNLKVTEDLVSFSLVLLD